jgi:MoaA/NifB/PqqE/SkfB family radical SAM enzyme
MRTWLTPENNKYMLHVELTNLCNAACPICPRYWSSTTLTRPGLEPTSITIEQFKEWFSPEFLKTQVQRVMLCGNQGDPFACKDIIPILEYVTAHLPKNMALITHSNGGLRKPDVWKRAGELLQGSKRWYMWFSIDGLQDTNHLYRRNVNWDKLMENVHAFMSAGGSAYWDLLVFKHNEHQIQEIRDLSTHLGFLGTRVKNPDGLFWDNKIQVRGVYDKDGILEHYLESATDPQYINAPTDAERSTVFPSKRIDVPDIRVVNFSNDSYDIYEESSINCKSLLQNGSEIMVQCDGLILPCCYIGEIWSSGRTDDAKIQLQHMWNIEKMYLTKNSFSSIMDYLDSTIMSSWNQPDYDSGKCMYCAKICGNDSPIDRLIHTKASKNA